MEQTRIPRPRGLTYSIIEERSKDSKLNQYSKAIKLLITLYTYNGMMINEEYISQERLANWLGLPLNIVMKMTNEAYLEMTNILGKDRDDIAWARSLLNQSLKLGLESRALSAHQAHLLVAEQGGHYTPYLSAAANQAIANLIASTKPITDIAKLYLDKTPQININNNNGDQNIQNNNYITAEQANILIQGHPDSPMLNEGVLESLKGSIGQLGLPTIDARIQGMNDAELKTDPALISANRAKKNKQNANPVLVERSQVHQPDTYEKIKDESEFRA